jgi:hypothetical protein
LRVLSRFVIAVLSLLVVASTALSATPARAAGPKVVVIVGPVGPLTDDYRERGDDIAAAAAAAGATVVKVYSPNATWAKVRAAVNGANVIVYVGHGNGYPNPYSATENIDRVNGWGLNMVAGEDDDDPTGDGDTINEAMVYCGEKALLGTLGSSDGAAQRQYCAGGPITPAANFVMVYSNACYTPGAGEERPAPAESVAVSRVANYSSPIVRLGGTYFATDLGSATLVDLILRNPTTPFGRIFEMGNGFSGDALRRFAHPDGGAAETWIQRTKPSLGDDYWYAFGGNPAETPSGSTVTYSPPKPMGISFSDIGSSPFAGDIIWMAEAGITTGCGGGKFCPKGTVTREQMASFLGRALGLPTSSTDFFTDDDDSPHEGDINRLAASRITGGCADGQFCPRRAVTREQMASFISRALGLPVSPTDFFTDDDDSPHEGDINRLAASGVTGGCASGRYCPSANVTREQMAAFLHRALMDG